MCEAEAQLSINLQPYHPYKHTAIFYSIHDGCRVVKVVSVASEVGRCLPVS